MLMQVMLVMMTSGSMMLLVVLLRFLHRVYAFVAPTGTSIVVEATIALRFVLIATDGAGGVCILQTVAAVGSV